MHGSIRGFTLLEALIVLTIICILLSLGMPALSKFIAHQKIVAANNTLVADLNFARSVAANQQQSMIVCPGNPTDGCSQTPMWEQGWIVFADSNQNRRLDQEESPLRVTQSVDKNIRISSSNYRKRVRFNPEGFAGGSNLSIHICHHAVLQGSKIVISNTGRVRQNRTQISQCGLIG